MAKSTFATIKRKAFFSYVFFAVALIIFIGFIEKDLALKTLFGLRFESSEKTTENYNPAVASQGSLVTTIWSNAKTKEKTDDKLDQNTQLKLSLQTYLQIRQACFAVLDVFAGKQSLVYKIFYSNLALDFINVHFGSFNASLEKIALQKSLDEIRAKLVKLQEANQKRTEDAVANEILPVFGNWLKRLKESFFNGESFGRHWTECKLSLEFEKKRIWDQLEKLQKGSTCYARKKANQFKTDLGNRIGLGSQFHRMGHCLATGLETNTTCFVEDETWNYHPGNYRKYFKNADHCAPKSSFRIRTVYESTRPWNQLMKNASLPSFPDVLWEKLAHCHEDLAAWYTGVLITFAMEPTEFAQEEVKKLQETKNLGDKYAALQIRSIDEYANMIEPELYTKYLKMATKFDEKFTGIKKVWIATDDPKNIQIIRAENSDFNYASWEPGYFDSARFKGEVSHLIGLLTDVNIVLEAPLVIGRMGSNLIRLAYEYRSVEDPLAIESLFSLDMLYYMLPQWVRHKFYLYDTSVILSAPLASRSHHSDFQSLLQGLKLKGLKSLCGGAKLVEVSDNQQPHIPIRDGFRQVSATCSNGREEKAYVPVYVLQRTYYTYQRHQNTQLQTVFINSHA